MADRSNGDTDYFRFSATKDEKLIFQSATRSLGSPCDLVLAIKSAEGKTFAQSDPNLPTDAALTNKFSEAGEYLLEVRELSGSITNVPYRIKAARFESGFASRVRREPVGTHTRGHSKIEDHLRSYEDIGKISFAIEPPIAGISLENAEIPEKKNEVEVTIKASDDVAPGLLDTL
jgi:hypothetical protein